MSTFVHGPRSLLAGLAMCSCLVPAAMAQDAGALRVGQTQVGSLDAGSVDVYVLDLDAEQYVFGRADQIDCDVVVTVYNPEGEVAAQYDGPARGHENFQFVSQAPGEYRIEVKAFEGESGGYTIELVRSEPLADTPEGKIDQVILPYDNPETPGGVVAVVRGGELVFSRAFGSANLTHNIPFTVDTRTNIGSTAKQFTAMAIMLLVEQGEIGLDDDIRDYVPELPDFGQTVTLRHLVTHTSGYREFLNTAALSGHRLGEGDSITRDEIIEMVQRQPELQNDPGAEWNYNNTGYSLLATVVSRVTDTPFPEWMRVNVFEPLGMDDSFVREGPYHIIPESAEGYAGVDTGGYRAVTDLHGAMGAGGLYASVEDLAHWVRNYKTHEVGTAESFAQMTTPYTLANGEETGYGFGLFIDEMGGLDRIQHGGADVAHRSMVMYFPELDAAVITQSNNAAFDGSIAIQAAIAFFEEHMSDGSDGSEESETESDSALAEFDPSTFDPETFDEYAGRYELEEAPGFILRFWREEGKYFTQATGQPQIEIVPIGQSEFKITIVDARIRFERNDEGVVDAITLFQNGQHPAKRLAEEEAPVDVAALTPYTGVYFSEELETFYRVEIEDDQLVIKQRRFGEVPLKHNKDHGFTGVYPVANAEFELGEDGNASALIVGNGRTRGVRFERWE